MAIDIEKAYHTKNEVGTTSVSNLTKHCSILFEAPAKAEQAYEYHSRKQYQTHRAMYLAAIATAKR